MKGSQHKVFGEVNFSGMAQAKRVGKFAHNTIPVQCGCGHKGKISPAYMKRIGPGKYKCSKCYKQGINDINQALINIAKRKGLMK